MSAKAIADPATRSTTVPDTRTCQRAEKLLEHAAAALNDRPDQPPLEESEVHHGTGDRAGDPLDELDLADDQAAEVVH